MRGHDCVHMGILGWKPSSNWQSRVQIVELVPPRKLPRDPEISLNDQV